ncbi:MAG TPA: S46 family peptidase [Longimicrobiales bacterium]|nr:S46 family peptidase [Longimicrobiales bacterium]
MSRLRLSALLLLAGAGACGVTTPIVEPEAPAPSPAPGAAISVLEPEAEIAAAAAGVELTGTELGTMWTLENPPLEYWRETYGFEATPAWLDLARLASVRYGNHCSASFVSEEGLVLTNHHCARDCVEAVSTEARDYVVEGFYAAARGEELVCPNLFLDQLVSITEVTDRVDAAAAPGAPATRVVEAMEAEQEAIEEECEAETGLVCQVVRLFQGGQYQLYRYQRHQPVKLVFAPELQAGFFGGDPDNFTYPRYATDFAFVRAYQGETPVRTERYFSWDPEGAAEGELVFITGNPGSTSRFATLSQLLYERHVRHPFILDFLEGQRDMLQAIAATGPEAERGVRDQLFGIENSIKAYTGQLGGLEDPALLARKLRFEQQFRERVTADPTLRREYGDVWDRIARLQARKVGLQPRVNISNPGFIGPPHVQVAAALVDVLRDTADPRARQQLLEPLELRPEASRPLLRLRLELARAWLAPDDPFLGAAFQPGESADDAARRLLDATRIGELEYRRRLIETGADPDTVDDPLVRLVAGMKDTYAEVLPAWQEITAGQGIQETRLARALFAVYGTRLPPDATFTFRITDGVVQGYPYNGTVAPWKTTFWGLYERSASFDNAMPFQLPEAFARAAGEVRLHTPVNFVTTNDITGGNSGSPMIDREGRLVGVAFDSNIEGLPNEFLFTTERGRTVGVHSAGILETLRIYDARALIEEILRSAQR